MQNIVDTTHIIDALKLITPYLTGGLAGAIFTLLARVFTDKRRRKQLKLDVNKQRFSLPHNSTEGGLSSESLTVSYQGKGYANLALYTVKLENSGYGGIVGQKLVIIFPKKTEILEELKKPSVSTIKVHEVTFSDDAITKSFSFERIERNDIVVISFLIDCEAIDLIQCKPRGVDEVDYVIENAESKSEIQRDLYRFLLYSSAFVLFGAVDIFGDILRALTLFMSIPTIMRLASALLFQQKKHTSEFEFDFLRIDESSGTLVILGHNNEVKLQKSPFEAA